MFAANFDVAGIRLPDGAPAARWIRRDGPFNGVLPFRYLGADDLAGPSHTGRPAAHSWYEPSPL
ncbi:hypothetical protein ACGFMK_43355 [Amycolatopsis sp. NPDC049252]|uniref:hypothetical protein n=1 Tax=Amycolatopsis sp. NPDC049252 TaxID=3363933 RepID=UPI00371DA5A7